MSERPRRGRAGRERNASPKLTVIYWQDIPSQVMAQNGAERISLELTPRFLKAIDSAAMFARKTDSKAYMEHWRKETKDCSDDLQAEAEKAIADIEAAYSKEDLRQLIMSKGVKKEESNQ